MNIIQKLTVTFTIGFLFALWCGIQLERSRMYQKKKKAGSKNKQRKIHCNRFNQRGGRSSMHNVEPGNIIYAVDLFHGSYIGELVSVRTSPAHTVQVKILGCLSYPKQYSEFYVDKPVERNPYPYHSIQNFSFDSFGKWVGDIPGYSRSIRNALNIAIKNCRPAELQTLLRHCNRKEGCYVCAG